MTTLPTVHATAVLLGDAGVLLRGPSGAGKSTSALSLIAHWRAQGRFATLVADDRVLLERRHGRVVIRSPRRLSGLVEARGLGILQTAFEPAAVLRLVVDLLPEGTAARMPESQDSSAELVGVILPRLGTIPGSALCPLVSEALRLSSQRRDGFQNTCVCAAT